MGIERCGQINSVNSGSDNCTGIGVISGFLAVVLIICGPHVEKVDLHGRSLISPHTTRGSARLQNSQSVHIYRSLGLQEGRCPEYTPHTESGVLLIHGGKFTHSKVVKYIERRL